MPTKSVSVFPKGKIYERLLRAKEANESLDSLLEEFKPRPRGGGASRTHPINKERLATAMEKAYQRMTKEMPDCKDGRTLAIYVSTCYNADQRGIKNPRLIDSSTILRYAEHGKINMPEGFTFSRRKRRTRAEMAAATTPASTTPDEPRIGVITTQSPYSTVAVTT